jgi:hypothetical protein
VLKRLCLPRHASLSNKPYKTCLSCQMSLNVTSTSTMQRFTELLLLVACTLPLLFVNGLQALQPSIKNNSLQTDAIIRGLLVPRQFFCRSGSNLCESAFCCFSKWNCCRGSSPSPSFEFKFHRRAKKFGRR